jgi:uncharacterized protein (DUF1015 family)
MTEKGWILTLIVLTIISLAFSAAIIFTGGYNSYVLRMVSKYETPDAQIKVLQKQYAIEKLQIPEDKIKEIENVVSQRYYIQVKEQNPNDVGVKDPFQGK